MFAIIGSVGHPKAKAAAKYPVVETQNKDLNINVIRSAWRRMRKGHIKVRDLQPQKDVKGGGGVTGNSKPITGGTGSTGTTSSH